MILPYGYKWIFYKFRTSYQWSMTDHHIDVTTRRDLISAFQAFWLSRIELNVVRYNINLIEDHKFRKFNNLIKSSTDVITISNRNSYRWTLTGHSAVLLSAWSHTIDIIAQNTWSPRTIWLAVFFATTPTMNWDYRHEQI